MKTVFIGAVEGSLRALTALNRAGHAPDLVVTLPPEKAQRHSDFADLGPTARAAGSQLLFTTNINDAQTVDTIAASRPDLAMVIGWSQICRAPFRAIPRLGTIGFHPAPLPELRGRASIPWTILTGASRTAASLFWIDEGCDTGDLAAQEPIVVDPDETARSLYDKQVDALCRRLPRVLDQIAAGRVVRTPQDQSRASYCARRRPEDGLIDWTRPAAELDRLIRAVGDPYPGAFTDLDGNVVHIDRAHVFDGPPRYVGLPGQIQDQGPTWVRISCGGFTCLEVTAWRSPGLCSLPRHAVLGRPHRVTA